MDPHFFEIKVKIYPIFAMKREREREFAIGYQYKTIDDRSLCSVVVCECDHCIS
jgi:hypothetical protein